jgi:glycosyltransferase involved in cell wall biosynthesis
MTPNAATNPELSIVVPALDEEDNVGPLIEEVRKAVVERGIAAELIVVDDGSTDQTLPRLRELARQYPWLRVLHRDKPMGQSAAMYAGIQAARGRFIATLDADLQNDPADLPAMLETLRAGNADMAQGCRAKRQDTVVRKATSWVGRTTRKLMLNDPIRDTGCTTRVVKAEIAKQFPLVFKGMHRFMPVYASMLGARVVEMPVNHRPRASGVAKYGILNRGLVGLFDTFAMRWMLRRYRDPRCTLVTREER